MRHPLRCSFCSKSADKVRNLIAGPKVHICDDCVSVCNRILEAAPGTQVSWDDMSEAVLLASLKPANAALSATRRVLQERVDQLRARDVSWTEIGAALGITRQAAWDRFAEKD